MENPNCEKSTKRRGLIALREFGWTAPQGPLHFYPGDEFDPIELRIPLTLLIRRLRVRLVGYGDVVRSFDEVVASGPPSPPVEEETPPVVVEEVPSDVSEDSAGEVLEQEPKFDLEAITEEEIRDLLKDDLIELAKLVEDEYGEDIDLSLNKEPLQDAVVGIMFE